MLHDGRFMAGWDDFGKFQADWLFGTAMDIVYVSYHTIDTLAGRFEWITAGWRPVVTCVD